MDLNYLAANVAGIWVPVRVTPKAMMHFHLSRILLLVAKIK